MNNKSPRDFPSSTGSDVEILENESHEDSENIANNKSNLGDLINFEDDYLILDVNTKKSQERNNNLYVDFFC
jgi:hypothetical protein